MADKFYRLISVLINICPDPLRELFKQNAKADKKPGVPYTTLDAYLANQKPMIESLKRRRKLRADQFDLLFPSLGPADESQWDITLLVVLILELYTLNVPNHIQFFIKDIRDVRNNLQHISKTSNVSDSTFKQAWDRLETATLTLARHVHGSHYEKTVKDKLTKFLVSNMPDLGNTLCIWFNERLTQMNHEMDEMRGKINEISEDARKCKTEAMKSSAILENASTVKPGPSGKENKRLKTVDKILKKMQDEFERTMNSESQENFTAPNEVDKIKSKLRDKNFVIVAGHNKSFYLAAALSAVHEMSYQEKRCVQLNTSSDWSHVDAEDVDFVLCCDPFGRNAFEEEKSKGMADIFSNIQYTVNEEKDGNKLAVMIVTDIAVLNDCKEKHFHEILEEVVTVYEITSRTYPADLTVARSTSKFTHPGSTITHNLKEQTRLFLQYHEVSSKQIDVGILSNAKAKFKAHKVVILVGPRKSGKTSLAVALAASYQPSQVLLLTYPEQVQHVDVDSTSLVIIEDFAGKHIFDQFQICNWYRTFDQLLFMSTAGKMNIVITCDKEKLEKSCKEIATHPLLEQTVELPLQRMQIKQETVDDDTHQAQSVSKETVISLDKSSSSQQSGSHLNLSVPKYSSIDRVNEYMDLKDSIESSGYFLSRMCLTKDNNIYVAARSFLAGSCLLYQDSDRNRNRIQTYFVKQNIDQMCCTKAGDVVAVTNAILGSHFQINIYSIIDSAVENKATYSLEGNGSLCTSVSCDDNNQVYMLFSDKKIKLYEKQSTGLVLMVEHTIHAPQMYLGVSDEGIINHKGHMLVTNRDRVYYLNFRTDSRKYKHPQWSSSHGICTVSEEPYSVFVSYGKRILQYNTNLEIISDISVPDHMQVTQMMFDKTQSRLICYSSKDRKIYEVYLR